MTQQNPTFSPSEFELRGYTNPYLSPDQKIAVADTEDRVSGELDFVAQMLGWSGPNYWSNLATTVNEKRQILGGTYGVYNSFVIPTIYEIRNWNDTIVVDPLPTIEPGSSTYPEYILVGEDRYTIQSVILEGDKYVISLGELPESFYTQIANNVQLKVSIPSLRPAPFVRSEVGVSGDGSFACSATGTDLTLYPLFDENQKFPYRFPTLFAGSVYYFNQPIYLSLSLTPSVDISPQYDAESQLWFLALPKDLTVSQLGLKAYLVWEYSNTLAATNALLEVTVQPWVDPSDWNTQSVLSNFRGAWNNKGGALPFNLVFDSLSIHGFNERNSLYFPRLERSWDFNSLIDEVYSQRISISESPPGAGAFGNLWWNSDTGALAAWIPSTDGCSNWVEIDYRSTPDAFVYGDLVYADVATFTANILNIPVGTQVTILDITGLSIADNVIGVQGILASPGALTLYRSDSTTPYWTPVQFLYLNEPDFASDAQLLPYGIPVLLGDATSLAPQANSYSISNLDQQILGDYAVSLTKFYTNTNWTVSSDSLLRYIANSSLFSSPLQGEAWWDFAVPDPQLRAASIYYQSAWVSINTNPPTAVPAAPCNLSVINFYCDGNLLVPSVQYSSDDYIFSYTFDILGGKYDFVYIPKSLKGKTQFPTITISDNLTTVYQSDITAKVFSGVDYYMSPNVYDAETTLRVWKAQDLQVAETTNHLEEDNYINPLLADLNNGPGPENWERYFIRLPLDYGRDQVEWQKAVLTCQNFGYWGSTVDPEQMRCPPEDDLPAIYEELFLYNEPVPDYTYVYCEPYLYSNIAYTFSPEPGDYYNASVFPASDVQFDEFSEAQFIDYDAFHSRQANFSLPHGQGFGNWLGQYVNVNPCIPLTGFLETDLVQGGVAPVAPPVWDASIYKFAPTCENEKSSYSVDANHYKVGYAYFVADASAAEDGFFDIQQEAAWRDPEPQSQSLYLLPR